MIEPFVTPSFEQPAPGSAIAAVLARHSNRNFFWGWFIAVNAALVTLAIFTAPLVFLIPLIGFGGAFLSLLFAKWLAKRAHGIRTIDPAFFRSGAERELHGIVANVAGRAGLAQTPEVGVYESPDINAFATGAGQKGSLVAFSSALLDKLSPEDIRAVAAHEVAHIANRDMLGIVLIQGVINSLIIAVVAPLNLLRIANWFSDHFSWLTELLLFVAKAAIALALALLGGLIVKAYSRRREFRADAVAAHLVGKEAIIAALTSIAKDDAAIPRAQLAYASFKIAGRSPYGEFFSTHPAIERRIAYLRQLSV